MSELEDFFGKPISSYTLEDAIQDGTIQHPYPDRWPWLCITNAIHAACTHHRDGRTYEQCLIPLLMDCILAAQGAQQSGREPPVELIGTVAGTVWIMPNDKGGMTVMKPEDY